MKYQQGDRVLLLHSGEEGEIIDFINEKMVTVQVNGVQFPVHTDQIDFPYFNRFSKKNNQPVKKPTPKIESLKKEKPSAKYKVDNGVWLIFLPVFDKDIFDDDIVDYFKIFLVNQTSDHLHFDYVLKYITGDDFELKNEILPWSDFYLHNVPFDRVNDSPKFDFEFRLKHPEKKKAAHFEASVKIKPKQLFQKVEEIRMKQLAHFSYLLYNEYPDRVEEEKETDFGILSKAGYRVYQADKARTYIEQARSVVDLHIEKLDDRWEKLDTYAILDLQLRTFEKYLELAIYHHLDSMIAIHGVGTGKLRDEIHDLLRLKREVKSFVNRYHPSFGYGATEIYFNR